MDFLLTNWLTDRPIDRPLVRTDGPPRRLEQVELCSFMPPTRGWGRVVEFIFRKCTESYQPEKIEALSENGVDYLYNKNKLPSFSILKPGISFKRAWKK